jgi:hypothetical protein
VSHRKDSASLMFFLEPAGIEAPIVASLAAAICVSDFAEE